MPATARAVACLTVTQRDFMWTTIINTTDIIVSSFSRRKCAVVARTTRRTVCSLRCVSGGGAKVGRGCCSADVQTRHLARCVPGRRGRLSLPTYPFPFTMVSQCNSAIIVMLDPLAFLLLRSALLFLRTCPVFFSARVVCTNPPPPPPGLSLRSSVLPWTILYHNASELLEWPPKIFNIFY